MNVEQIIAETPVVAIGTCRHCGQPIRQYDLGRWGIGRWVHVHNLRRCRQPEHITVYGYEALPDDGRNCICWACTNLGPSVRTPDEADGGES